MEFLDELAERMIYCFLVGTKLSTEKAKFKLDMYYAMRHQLPEIYSNRDPTLEDVRTSVDRMCVSIACLTKPHTATLCRVLVGYYQITFSTLNMLIYTVKS